jgi:hypothetical protein
MCVFVGCRREEQRTEKEGGHAQEEEREREREREKERENHARDGKEGNGQVMEEEKTKERMKAEKEEEELKQKQTEHWQQNKWADNRREKQRARAAEEHSRHCEPARKKQGTRMEELESSSSCTRQLRERERDTQGTETVRGNDGLLLP